jgi:lipoprotein-releasing system ATP-binding protein
VIKISHLNKTFVKDGAHIDVLKDLNLTIDSGDSLAIVGVSGSGKSTLIHILGTLDRPTSGEIRFEGQDVFVWPEEKLAAFRNKQIGFVFQFNNLLPEFSSLENVMMPALIHGVSKKEARERAELLLKDMGLHDRTTHKPGELSGGEQQRVAVARALVMEPALLLADEPTGNLDTETGARIGDLLVRLNQTKGITLVVVTHNAMLARQMSRSIGLQDGRIVFGE